MSSISNLHPVADPKGRPRADASDAAAASAARKGDRKAYWRANLKILGVLLSIWFAVSYGCGILFADALDAVNLPGTGYPLGFWFAQQGAIYVFVGLIFVYVWLMNRLDARFGVSEDEETQAEL